MNNVRKHVSDMFAWLLELRWMDSRISLALASHTTIPERAIDPNVRYDRGMVFLQDDNKFLLRQDRNLNPDQPLNTQGCQLFAPPSPRDWFDEEFCLRGIPEGRTEEIICQRYDAGRLYQLRPPNAGQRWRIYEERTRPSQRPQDWEPVQE